MYESAAMEVGAIKVAIGGKPRKLMELAETLTERQDADTEKSDDEMAQDWTWGDEAQDDEAGTMD